jgi:dihydroxyacetone kinase-like protein
MTLDADWAVRWALLAANAVRANRTHLIELDRPIGDADHGENMTRGFDAVAVELESARPARTVGEVLQLVAKTLISTVGGAAGPLYGTAFLRAAKAVDVPELDANGIATMFQAALDGVTARGKATTGEKTMVDAWAAATRAAQEAAAGGADAAATLAAAADGAEAGAVATEPMIATKGRASYLGERSAGHRDPGAESTAIIVRAAVSALTS